MFTDYAIIEKNNKISVFGLEKGCKTWKTWRDSELTEEEKSFLANLPKLEHNKALKAIFNILHFEKFCLEVK